MAWRYVQSHPGGPKRTLILRRTDAPCPPPSLQLKSRLLRHSWAKAADYPTHGIVWLEKEKKRQNAVKTPPPKKKTNKTTTTTPLNRWLSGAEEKPCLCVRSVLDIGSGQASVFVFVGCKASFFQAVGCPVWSRTISVQKLAPGQDLLVRNG